MTDQEFVSFRPGGFLDETLRAELPEWARLKPGEEVLTSFGIQELLESNRRALGPHAGDEGLSAA